MSGYTVTLTGSEYDALKVRIRELENMQTPERAYDITLRLASSDGNG